MMVSTQGGPLLVINGVITNITPIWPHKGVTGVITPISGVISLLLTMANVVFILGEWGLGVLIGFKNTS